MSYFKEEMKFSNHHFYSFWSPEEVAAWVTKLGFGEAASYFTDKAISGQELELLTEENFIKDSGLHHFICKTILLERFKLKIGEYPVRINSQTNTREIREIASYSLALEQIYKGEARAKEARIVALRAERIAAEEASERRKRCFAFSSCMTIALPSFVIMGVYLSLQKNKRQDASHAIADTQDLIDDTENVNALLLGLLAGISDQIRLSLQRIDELNCVKSAYKIYNYNLTAFSQKIRMSNASALESLEKFWNIRFVNNSAMNTTQSSIQSWDAGHQECYEGYYYPECHWEPEIHYYTQTFDMTKTYSNILVGTGLSIASLNCGVYSRSVNVLPTITYLVASSPTVSIGNRESGAVTFIFSEDYGSKAPLYQEFEGSITVSEAVSDFYISMEAAAEQVEAQLSQWLGAAVITALAMTETNYTTLQQGFLNRIPVLLEQAVAVNETFRNGTLFIAAQQAIIANQQAVIDTVNHEANTTNPVWVVLGLLPLVVGAFVYGIQKCIGKKVVVEEENDIEMPKKFHV